MNRIHLVTTATAILLALLAAGCELPGTCRVYCSGDDFSTEFGPYEDYTESACEDEAASAELDGVATCSYTFEPY